jgi:2-methylisocitrate lyase-like PEP mutase family enzyme
MVADLNKQAEDAGRGKLEVVAMKTLPLDNRSEAVELAQAYRDAGATHLVHTQDYNSPEEYQVMVDIVSQEIRPAVL